MAACGQHLILLDHLSDSLDHGNTDMLRHCGRDTHSLMALAKGTNKFGLPVLTLSSSSSQSELRIVSFSVSLSSVLDHFRITVRLRRPCHLQGIEFLVWVCLVSYALSCWQDMGLHTDEVTTAVRNEFRLGMWRKQQSMLVPPEGFHTNSVLFTLLVPQN